MMLSTILDKNKGGSVSTKLATEYPVKKRICKFSHQIIQTKDIIL